MRCVVQRVRSARVEVDGQTVSSIGPGLLCLVGLKESDTTKDVDYICKKILKTRIFPTTDQARASWDEDVVTKKGEILLVSQFTLYARLRKPRPDFSKAMGPQQTCHQARPQTCCNSYGAFQARDFYQEFVERVRREYQPELVKDGVFGAMMNVSLENDGPVTFMLDSEADLLEK